MWHIPPGTPVVDGYLSSEPIPYNGPGSSVGITTGYGLDGPGIE